MLEDLQPGWLWLIGGVLLLMLEIVAPGFFLLFIGAAAIATGLFVVLFDLGLAPALALFALYTALAVAVGRKVYANRPVNSSDPHLNDRSARLIGRTVTVVEAVDEHGGRVRVGDGDWSARGDHAEPGSRVRITGVDGNCLTVEAERTLPPA
ncbi:MAG: Putative activity regulator of membrane protease YbbK [uncultured Sphingomonas sp.]|uniref:Activity regulator of membrane protease YbbK n=1 Tax=uncultured Sphingomonas sp. TaxID=158754 RepID=A0A6J4SL08_9SPHN|nr:NfeD family protein [uncultured Sphingomonas sp.]CAA9502021.1 MAG: Putative activity regulator of membrane protease YbbK [uncultured Sphingomonas sp.]